MWISPWAIFRSIGSGARQFLLLATCAIHDPPNAVLKDVGTARQRAGGRTVVTDGLEMTATDRGRSLYSLERGKHGLPVV